MKSHTTELAKLPKVIATLVTKTRADGGTVKIKRYGDVQYVEFRVHHAMSVFQDLAHRNDKRHGFSYDGYNVFTWKGQ